MQRVSIVTGCIPIFVIVIAVSPTVVQTDAETVFAQQCAMCHGESGAGDGTAAVAMNLEPASFAEPTFQESQTDEQLADAIGSGKGTTMPGYADRLSAEQIGALVSYIRRLGGQDQ
jgi:high-affinity iron transporter